MKTLTISSDGKITRGLITTQGAVDKYVQLSTDTTSKYAKAYISRESPAEVVRTRVGQKYHEIIYDAYYVIFDDYLLFTEPREHNTKDLFLVLLKREQIRKIKGLVEIRYQREEIKYTLLIVNGNSEFEIYSTEEEDWIKIIVNEP
jgi:hypothetical protein